MKQEELTNVFKYIVKKCDMLINNGHYEADAYTQDIVEDIAELCNHILDENYGKLVEVKEMDLENEYKVFVEEDPVYNKLVNNIVGRAIAKHFFELGMQQAQKGNNWNRRI